MNEVEQIWDHSVLDIKRYATVPVLLWCLSVFLSESILSLHSWWCFYTSVLFSSPLCSLSHSFFDLLSFSINSISLAFSSVCFSSNQFSKAPFFLKATFQLNHYFLSCVLYSVLLMWFLFLFYFPSLSFASLFFATMISSFFIVLLLHLLHFWCWPTINLFAFRWIDKNIAYERAKSFHSERHIPSATYLSAIQLND